MRREGGDEDKTFECPFCHAVIHVGGRADRSDDGKGTYGTRDEKQP